MKKNLDTKKWQLIRCIYDSNGIWLNEYDNPKPFDFEGEWAKAKEEWSQSYFIGRVVLSYKDRQTSVEILEGKKEVLELILDLVKNKNKSLTIIEHLCSDIDNIDSCHAPEYAKKFLEENKYYER